MMHVSTFFIIITLFIVSFLRCYIDVDSKFLPTKVEEIISHSVSETKLKISDYIEHIQQKKDLLSYSVEDTVTLVKELASFDFGRYMLKNKGWNGFWTQYAIIKAPQIDKSKLSELEYWILHNSPLCKATQQRYKFFKTHLQYYLNQYKLDTNKNQPYRMVSVPSGLMDDLLSLDFTETTNVHLYGFDLDTKGIEKATENVLQYSSSLQRNNVQVSFTKSNAWELNSNEDIIKDKYDIVTSNGLNIYVHDENQVIELYRQFRSILKVGGILITSFIVPPQEWRPSNPDDAIKSKVIFFEIIEFNTANYRTEDTKRKQLESVGFKIVDVIYDDQHIFPTIIAQAVVSNDDEL